MREKTETKANGFLYSSNREAFLKCVCHVLNQLETKEVCHSCANLCLEPVINDSDFVKSQLEWPTTITNCSDSREQNQYPRSDDAGRQLQHAISPHSSSL